MQYTIILIALCGVPGTSAAGGTCPAGEEWQTAVTMAGSTLYCNVPASSATSQLEKQCQKSCCSSSASKACSSYGAAVAACTTGTLFVWSTAGLATVSSQTEIQAKCCTDVYPTCKTWLGSCPQGKKAKTGQDATKCTSIMCNECCENDDKVCGATVSCGSGFYSPGDLTKVDYTGKDILDDVSKAEKEAWKVKATTEANKNTDCCTAVATCAAATFTCDFPGSPGSKKKTTGNCPKNGASCGPSCCEKDLETCGGLSPTCPAGKVRGSTDAWSAKKSAKATEIADCCSDAPVCSAHTCKAGKKKKAAVQEAKCQLAELSSCDSTCCEWDATKCKGLEEGGASCGSGKVDTGSGFVKATAQATQDAYLNTVATTDTYKDKCCSTKATCQDFKAGISRATTSGTQQVHPGSFIVLVGGFALTSLCVM